MHPFVIVSNRLPVSVTKVDGKLHFNVSSGGLATAMSSLDIKESVWVGWPGIAVDDLTAADKKQIEKELAKHNCYPVHLTAKQVSDYYEGYANDVLWPLFHYFQSYMHYTDTYWEAYQAVNWEFLKAVQHASAPDATIWIQDYQLMLLPALVRGEMPWAQIGFFLHIPFPSYEIYRFLPQRREILEGLLGADLLGFHIYDYAQYFINSCNHLLGTTTDNGYISYQGRQVKVDAFPIGIDYEKFRQTLDSPGTKRAIANLTERYKTQKLVLSVDRLDYTKGIMKRLDAFDLFLKEHPEYIGKVTLIVIAVPSRTQVEAYQKLRETIEQAVSRINGTYSTSHWSPISYQFQNLRFEEVVALYAKSDVALVTPLRDGMNLVAKEYVASKRGRAGVLILSELAGAADELTDALTVNPNHTTHLADSLYRALTMPRKEQFVRLQAMQKRISTYSVQKWGNDFMQQLAAVTSEQTHIIDKQLTTEVMDTIVKEYSAARSRLLILNYDGTLRNFTADLSAIGAQPDDELLDILTALCSDNQTQVCIVSGRPRRLLNTWLGKVPRLRLIAEHGAWMKVNGSWTRTAKPFDTTAVLELMEEYALRTAGAVVENKDFAVVWHYRGVNPELAYVRNRGLLRDLKPLTDGTDLSIQRGNKIIEVKPRSLQKSNMARYLSQRYQSEFILCIGDDENDEDMFKNLPATAHTVKVGYGPTNARHETGRIDRAVSLLERLSRAKSKKS